VCRTVAGRANPACRRSGGLGSAKTRGLLGSAHCSNRSASLGTSKHGRRGDAAGGRTVEREVELAGHARVLAEDVEQQFVAIELFRARRHAVLDRGALRADLATPV
jgi:hypothetical protein